MSFEGYCITVCQHGHLLEEPYDYGGDDHAEVCPVCGAPWVWSYTVDLTNDSGVAPVLEVQVQGDDEIYYLPKDEDPDHYRDLEGLDHPPINPVEWQDLDHPDDGPFTTEQAAWDNKTMHWRASRKAKADRAQEVRLAAKTVLVQQRGK